MEWIIGLVLVYWKEILSVFGFIFALGLIAEVINGVIRTLRLIEKIEQNTREIRDTMHGIHIRVMHMDERLFSLEKKLAPQEGDDWLDKLQAYAKSHPVD
jgi:hypothetical protein